MSSIEKDERLLPLPNAVAINLPPNQDVPSAYAPFYDDDSFSEGRPLREYFLIVYKKLPLILALTILVTAAVAFYMYRLPSVYEASTTLVIEPRKPKAQQGNNVYINYGEDINYYNTQLRLLRNSDLMRSVVLQMGLYNDPNLLGQNNKGFVSALRSMVSGDKTAENQDSLPVLTSSEGVIDLAALTPEQKSRTESYTASLLGGLIVEQQPSTNLINIKVTSTNPELAPRVANMVAKTFIEQDAKRAVQGAEETYEDLSNSIDQLKASIAEKEQERLNQMGIANLPLGADGKGNDLNAMKLQTLSNQFITAEDDRRKIQAQYEAAVAANKRGEIMSVVGPTGFINQARENILKLQSDLEKRVDDVDKQISEAEAKRSQLLVKYTEDYPEVKQVNAQIEKLEANKKRIETEVKSKVEEESRKLEVNASREVLTGLQAQLAATQRREAELKAAYFREVGISGQQALSEVRLTTLTNEIETSRTLLNTYTQRQKEMELTIKSSRPDNISVSSAAQEAAPVGPQRNRNIIIAFLLSLGFGVGLAFLMDYLDDSIKTSDDIGKHLGLPTLALIPHESVLGRRKNTQLADGSANISSTALIAIENNRSPIAEAYRHLRTALLFSSAGKPPQTILVTSSQPSEGKTTTAINTAITLAQSGADVVVIDCDLRRPRIHSHFGMDNSTGITNYLSGERNLEKLLKPYAALPKVKVITSGPIPPNPAELLSSNEMKNLLTSLKGKFNHIIVDSPPAISFTDAAVLSTLVDGVIVVAMAGKSSIQLIRRFKQRLNSVGTRIYGVVLNGIKPDSFEYGYYGYGYEYDHYDETDETTPRMKDDVKVEKSQN